MSLSPGTSLLCISIRSSSSSRKALGRWHTLDMCALSCPRLTLTNFWQKTRERKSSHHFLSSKDESLYHSNYFLTNVCQKIIQSSRACWKMCGKFPHLLWYNALAKDRWHFKGFIWDILKVNFYILKVFFYLPTQIPLITFLITLIKYLT